MFDRIKLAQYPLEQSVRPISLSRDRTTVQVRLKNRYLLIFLQPKPS